MASDDLSNANLTEEGNVEIQIVGKFGGEIELLTGPAPDAHSRTVMISVSGINFATTANFRRPRPANADEITSRKDAIEVGGSFSLKLLACSIAAITLPTGS